MLRRIGRLFRIHPIGICGSFEFKAVGWALPHTPLQTFCQMCFPSFPNGLGMALKVSQAPGWSKDAGFYLAVSWSLNVGSYRFSHHFGAQVPSSYKRPCQHFHESQCSELYIPLLPCVAGGSGGSSPRHGLWRQFHACVLPRLELQLLQTLVFPSRPMRHSLS